MGILLGLTLILNMIHFCIGMCVERQFKDYNTCLISIPNHLLYTDRSTSTSAIANPCFYGFADRPTLLYSYQTQIMHVLGD